MSDLTDALKEYRERLTKAETDIKLLRTALKSCITQLREVRTGTDFECDCWEIAHQAELVLDGPLSLEYETLTEIPEDVMKQEFKS